MKFLVSDQQSKRHEKIRSYLKSDTAIIAALLAAVDLEWTIRRVIDVAIFNLKYEANYHRISSLEMYAKAWNEVFRTDKKHNLQIVIGKWDSLLNAYQLRHNIVHGKKGSGGVGYISNKVEIILSASEAVARFGIARGADPFKRLRKASLTRQSESNAHHWILLLDSHICTFDDIRLFGRGTVFGRSWKGALPTVGDVAIIFDRRARRFRGTGIFNDNVQHNVVDHAEYSYNQFDFSLKTSFRRQSEDRLSDIKERIKSPNHPIAKGLKTNAAFIGLSKSEFEDLIFAWQGITSLT